MTTTVWKPRWTWTWIFKPFQHRPLHTHRHTRVWMCVCGGVCAVPIDLLLFLTNIAFVQTWNAVTSKYLRQHLELEVSLCDKQVRTRAQRAAELTGFTGSHLLAGETLETSVNGTDVGEIVRASLLEVNKTWWPLTLIEMQCQGLRMSWRCTG